MVSCLWVSPSLAAGVAVTMTPSSSSTSPTAVKYQWVTGSAEVYTAGSLITLTVSPAMTDMATTTVPLSIDGSGVSNAILTAHSGSAMTILVTADTAATTTFAIMSTTGTGALLLTFDGSAQNYSIATFASPEADFGAGLFYANGGNQVNVSATVPATLSFAIRNAADSANTNSCALGTLSTASTSTCSYRLRIETNASTGFTATIQADHDLGSGSATMTAATNDGFANAGTEGYGISNLVGSTSGGRNTVTGAYDQPASESNLAGTTFNADISPVPTTTAVAIISYSGSFSVSSTPSLTGTTLVTHFANISSGTPAGNYTQTVTYLVTASY